MRSFPFGPTGGAPSERDDDDALELTGGMPPPPRQDDNPARDDDYGVYTTNLPVVQRPSRWRWVPRGVAAAIVLFVVAVGWLAVTAPLSKSLQPPTPPSITLLADDGTPIARRGAILDPPVDAAKLPKTVTNAFLAIEDRRFRSHWGIDPRGIARAFFHNMTSKGRDQGGSTITQQLAKNAFLDSDRTAARKIREVMIAFWLEAWLSKDQILSRYLSNVYFGDNVYGLRAAARHYFGRTPENLSIAQAAMLAGLVKAPSKLAPTVNLQGARDRAKLVVAAMVAAGFLDKADAAAVRPARIVRDRTQILPNGTYFADWVLPEARDQAGEIVTETTVQTTLDRRLQKAAERAVKRAGLRDAQIALVAMRPDGRVVAMVGGKSYADSPFNRATQAQRQPGSAFKLFVYLAAMRHGMTPDSAIDDEPITIAKWSPKNSDGRYLGPISLRQAFARSSNVAAARITQQVGVASVIQAARDLGVSTPIPNEATIALGTSSMSLLELTAAYASVAAEHYPVRPRGLEGEPERGVLATLTDRSRALSGDLHDHMLDLLSASAETGTGRAAALSVPTYGKTGTTQDNRDALFIGFANGLVCGVWVGNDDNTPNAGLSGGGIPARVWRDFMQSALGVGPAVAPEPEPETVDPDAGNGIDETLENFLDPANIPDVEGEIPGVGRVRLRGGELDFQPNRPGDPDRGPRPRRDRSDERAPPPRDPFGEQ
ncbi:transglycosylase domain-containing protein [Sphingomonas psychrolutea]|uniref:peptidoglycan glycosyltransferase n=1 Tax=Sphingomonas psychrolutea TaxID=1259676 RepID=A0ABQ1GW08_9SPHN|nr:PBP1A family penicillin-binding protein [Sphingomonas psychrolutea]GGA51156.1 penicillin-binding protein 1A [Sphingomonas psychrolutea]